jgi:hypothetical protein
MNKKEIQQEIESLRLKLRTLEKKLATGNNFGDEKVRRDINTVAKTYRDTLAIKGELIEIGDAFGEVIEIGEYKHRGLFLSNNFNERGWEWIVFLDSSTNSEVLVRVDKKTGNIID